MGKKWFAKWSIFMRNKDTRHRISIGAVASILLGLITFGIVLYYIVEVAKWYYHSDCTDTIMWAEAACDANSLVNEDFGYAGLMPFGGQLFMIPFVKMWGVGLKAQIAGITLFYLSLCAGIILLCRAMKFGWGWTAATLSTVLLLVSSSEKLREIFWGHIIYYSQGVLGIVVGVALVLLCLNNMGEGVKKKDKKINKEILYEILLVLWTVICSANGVQMAVLYVVPLVGAILLERYFDIDKKIFSKTGRSYYILAGRVAVASLMGLVIGALVKGEINVSYADAYSSFSKMSSWSSNALQFFTEYFSLIGVSADEYVIMYSYKGILILLRILAGCVLIIAPVVMAVMYKRFKQVSYRIMIIVYHITALIILAGWIFGRLNAANWRLSPLVGLSAILCIMLAKWLVDSKKYMRFFVPVFVPLLVLAVITGASICTMDKSSQKNQELNYVVELLENNNLEYGYATFWNANIITLLSDSNVKVRNITLSEEGYKKRIYQSNKNWYENAPEYDRYFLIMSNAEYERYYDIYGCIEEPDDVMASGEYVIFVYNHRLF